MDPEGANDLRSTIAYYRRQGYRVVSQSPISAELRRGSPFGADWSGESGILAIIFAVPALLFGWATRRDETAVIIDLDETGIVRVRKRLVTRG